MKLMIMIKRIFKKEEKPNYPSDFAIIDFSPVAKQNGIRDEFNKIIYRYSFDTDGNRIIKKYRFSNQMIQTLREVSQIPIYDKTTKKEVLPIFGKMLPSELSYNQ